MKQRRADGHQTEVKYTSQKFLLRWNTLLIPVSSYFLLCSLPWCRYRKTLHPTEEHLLLSQLQQLPAVHGVPAGVQFAHGRALPTLPQTGQRRPSAPGLQPLPLHAEVAAQVGGSHERLLAYCFSHAGMEITCPPALTKWESSWQFSKLRFLFFQIL